jgi:hypothetical protein
MKANSLTFTPVYGRLRAFIWTDSAGRRLCACL